MYVLNEEKVRTGDLSRAIQRERSKVLNEREKCRTDWWRHEFSMVRRAK